jgi:membrane-bound inhibitor of C-type lysozyme
MKIEWNTVTRFSQIMAVVLFVVIYAVGFQVGRIFETQFILGKPEVHATFVCGDKKVIDATFYDRFVHLEFGWQKTLYLPQTISADGARYANKDESVVFWNKGNTAFITEGTTSTMTYKDCVTDTVNQ